MEVFPLQESDADVCPVVITLAVCINLYNYHYRRTVLHQKHGAIEETCFITPINLMIIPLKMVLRKMKLI